MLDYARIKSVAAKAGMSVRDLLALGTGRTPGKIDASLMDDLDTSTYDAYTPPTASEVQDTDDKWLYDSRLKYVEQIHRYRTHQQQSSSGDSTDGLMEVEDP